MPTTVDVRIDATLLLTTLRTRFKEATAAIAQMCAIDGRLDGKLLDAHQPLCYELALAGAELLAAETSLGMGHTPTALDSALSQVFAVDAVTSVLGRLQSLFADAGLDGTELHVLSSGSVLAGLRRSCGAHGFISAVGRLVSEAGGDVGAVLLHQDAAMAQDAFRRFAADVVAPMAEEIHRRDLIVPESLPNACRP